MTRKLRSFLPYPRLYQEIINHYLKQTPEEYHRFFSLDMTLDEMFVWKKACPDVFPSLHRTCSCYIYWDTIAKASSKKLLNTVNFDLNYSYEHHQGRFKPRAIYIPINNTLGHKPFVNISNWDNYNLRGKYAGEQKVSTISDFRSWNYRKAITEAEASLYDSSQKSKVSFLDFVSRMFSKFSFKKENNKHALAIKHQNQLDSHGFAKLKLRSKQTHRLNNSHIKQTKSI